jgi:branched-chain amino acid transport system permease protein
MDMIFLGLSLASIYAVSAIGLTFIFGQMHIINWAHGGAYMAGAYAFYCFNVVIGINYVGALLFSIISVGTIGLIVESCVFRPLKGAVVASIPALAGTLFLMESLGYIIFGTLDKHVPPLFGKSLILYGVSFSRDRLFIIVLAVILIAGLYFFMNRTKTGLAMRSIEQDKEAASILGVNINTTNALAFFIGFALAGASGALVAPLYSVNPSMWGWPLLKSFIVVILGGLGSIPGAAIAAVIIGFVDGILGTLLGSSAALLFSFVVVIVVLIVRPHGIMGNPSVAW